MPIKNQNDADNSDPERKNKEEERFLRELENDILRSTPKSATEKNEEGTPREEVANASAEENPDIGSGFFLIDWLIRFLKFLYWLFFLWWWDWIFKKPQEENTEETPEEIKEEDTDEATGEETKEEETTGETTSVEPCVVIIEGPDCVCRDEIHTYTTTSVNCPGGQCKNWKIDEPAIAIITHTDECEARILVGSEGIFEISCDYIYFGQRIHVKKEVHAYSVKHVMGGTADSEVETAPLVQPHPFLQITSPNQTADDECLANSHFRVHRNKLDTGFPRYLNDVITLNQFIKEYFEVEVLVRGSIADFFKETITCSWSVNGQDAVELIKNEEFTDTSFETKIPGENNLNDRVILLKEMGQHVVKIIAENPISRFGSDWITLYIGFTENANETLGRLKDELAVLIQNLFTNPHAGHASAILNKQNEIKAAYLDGLKNPCISCSKNHQVAQSFTLRLSDKTRTHGRDDDRAGDTQQCTVVSETPTVTDQHVTELKQQGATIFLTEEPVKEFWVTQENYIGSEYNWDEDGMLLGDKNGTLSSIDFHCCSDTIDVFGVEIVSQDCFVTKKGQTIDLKAEGLPGHSDSGPGLYYWEVISKPGEDAVAEILPNTWTPSDTAQLEVDTSGIYTVKVYYQLGGRVCPLTYAIKDILINFEIASEVRWEVRRLGHYPQRLMKHLSRPYYQERKPEEVLAAEMLITPKNIGTTAVAVGGTSATPAGGTATTSAGSSVIGKRFSCSFLIPPEISFDEDLTLRAYYKPYSPLLDPDDYEDFTGAPVVTIDPQKPYEAMVDLITKKDIHAIHVIRIKYKNITALKGQAVPIHLVFWAPDALACPEETGTTGSTSLIDEGEETTQINGRQDLSPLVNLLVYNRDLGVASPSNGYQALSHAQDYHNVPNGNLDQVIPLFSCNGEGEPLKLGFHYNSLQASYQDSLELLKVLNGLTAREIHEEYCDNPIGKGWTHSYNVYLRDYVRPVDHYGKILKEYMELACPDGNRIQFVANIPESDNADPDAAPLIPSSPPTDYLHEFRSDHWIGNAANGLAVQLKGVPNTQGDMEYEVVDLNRRKLKFDKSKALVEITNRIIENASQLRATTLEYDELNLKITDSSERELVIRRVPHESTYNGFRMIRHPDGVNTIMDFSHGRLQDLSVGPQIWHFEYYDDLKPLGVPHPGSFLRSVKDPRDVSNLYEYYEGYAYYGVSEEVARDFWGRLGKVLKGGGNDSREQVWRYKKLNREKQQVIYRNGENVEFEYEYQLKELAVIRRSYLVQDKDDVSMKMLGVPNYAQVLADNTVSLPLKTIEEHQYYNETKLLASQKDKYGNEIIYSYTSILNDTAYLLETIQQPNGTVLRTEYNGEHLIEKVFNPKNVNDSNPADFKEYQYNGSGQVTKMVLPDTGGNPLTEEFTFDPDTGRLLTQKNAEGVVTTFAYNENNRDDHKIGFSTSRAIVLSKDRASDVTLTWEMTYDVMGRLSKTFDPLYGTNTAFEYHDLGPITKVTLQEIPTYTGSAYSSEVFTTYDELLSKIGESEGGRVLSWGYNNFGDEISYSDPSGTTWHRTYNKSSGLIKLSMMHGKDTDYILNELNHIVRVDHPRPDDRNANIRSQMFADAYFFDDDNEQVIEKRYLIANRGVKLEDGDAKLTRTTKLKDGLVEEIKEEYAGGGSVINKKYIYDNWGGEKEVMILEGSQVKHKLEIKRDSLGREVKHTESYGGSSREVLMTYTPSGKIETEQLPAIGTATGNATPKTSNRYDELGRLLEIKDSFDHVNRKLEYIDFGDNGPAGTLTNRQAKVIEKAQDPSANAGQGGLVTTKEMEFNRRGLITDVYLGNSRSLNWKVSRKYDAMGRVKELTDENGKIQLFDYDWENRVSVVTQKYKQRNPTVDWDNFDSANSNHIEEKETIAFYDYTPHGEIEKLRTNSGEENYTYDALGRLIEFSKPGSGREKLQFDLFDQVIKKELGNGSTAIFEYSQANRQVDATYTNSAAEIKARYRYDWDHRIQEFQYLKYRGGELNIFKEGYKLKYDYDEFGKLWKKEYFESGNQLRQSLEYTHDHAGLRKQMKAYMNPDGRPPFNAQVDYEYDANMRLVSIDAGTTDVFQFKYNDGGVLKKIGRPQLGLTPDVMANSTTYEHDPNGRLTKIIERKGDESVNEIHSEVDLFYSPRTRESWEKPTDWDVAEKGLIDNNTPVLKGMSYRRYFAENSIPQANFDKYTQDYVYDGNGIITGSITQWKTYPEVLVDSRHSEINAILTEGHSHRNYKKYDWNSNTAQENIGYHIEEKRVFGVPQRLYKRIGTRDPWVPTTNPKGFTETREFNGQTHVMVENELVEEDLSVTAVPPVAQPVQNHKEFIHDALDRLIVLKDRADIRTSFISGDMLAEDVDPTHQSFVYKSRMLYDADGSDIYTETTGNGIPGGKTQTYVLRDGAEKILEYKSSFDELTYWVYVPGLNIKLAVRSIDSGGVPVTDTMYYRWDHKGTTLYTTNFEGNVVTDYQYGSHDGKRDLFGLTLGPGVLGNPTTGRRDLLVLWNYFQSSGPRADLLTAQSTQLVERTEEITTRGLHPTISAGGANNYGFTAEYPYVWNTTTLPELTPHESVLQQVIDFNRGFWDTMTFGITKGLREKLHYESQPLDVNAYMWGFGIGFGVQLAGSLATGAGLPRAMASLAHAQRLMRLSQVYFMAGDVISVAKSTYNAATGQFTAIDILGFLPMYSFATRKNIARARRIFEYARTRSGVGGFPAPKEYINPGPVYLESIDQWIEKPPIGEYLPLNGEISNLDLAKLQKFYDLEFTMLKNIEHSHYMLIAADTPFGFSDVADGLVITGTAELVAHTHPLKPDPTLANPVRLSYIASPADQDCLKAFRVMQRRMGHKPQKYSRIVVENGDTFLFDVDNYHISDPG